MLSSRFSPYHPHNTVCADVMPGLVPDFSPVDFVHRSSRSYYLFLLFVLYYLSGDVKARNGCDVKARG